MLTRTTARRSAAVVMVAVVAALLVATGGSVRTAHARTSAGTGAGTTQNGAVSHGGRHVVSVHSSAVDLVALHLDLATTPPTDAPSPAPVPAERADADETADVSGDRIAAVGRGPPTV